MSIYMRRKRKDGPIMGQFSIIDGVVPLLVDIHASMTDLPSDQKKEVRYRALTLLSHAAHSRNPFIHLIIITHGRFFSRTHIQDQAMVSFISLRTAFDMSPTALLACASIHVSFNLHSTSCRCRRRRVTFRPSHCSRSSEATWATSTPAAAPKRRYARARVEQFRPHTAFRLA